MYEPGSIQIPAPGYIMTVAGNGTASYAGDGGDALLGEMYYPTGVAVDVYGNVYIADHNNHRIRRVGVATGDITTVAGNGAAGFAGDGGLATSAELNYPESVSVDSSGNLYIADLDNNRIREVSAATGVITTIAGTGTAGFSGDGGAATSANINQPYGIAIDASGNVYFADYNNCRIREISSSGTISTVAGNGTCGYSGDGGSATSAELYTPTDVALDGAGNLYIVDYQNSRIRKVTSASGVITTVAGGAGVGFAGDGGAATSAKLYYPLGVTVDPSGNIFIADEERIREVTASNGVINTIAGNGTGGYAGDGGSATNAELGGPFFLALDGAGNLYFADVSNERIRVVGGAASPKSSLALIVSTSGSPSIDGSSVQFTATISTSGTSPSGTVSFYSNGSFIGSGTISGTAATFTTSSLAVGSDSITTSWPGDSNYNPASSSPINQTVVEPNSPTVSSVTPASVPPGGNVTVQGFGFGTTQSGGQVTVNGYAANVTSWSDTNIAAILSIGTPNGNDQVVVTARSATSNAFPLAVPPAPVITTATLPNGSVGASYSTQLQASGGAPPYTWSIVGSLPPGLSLYNGEISGTPTTSGSYTFGVSVSDSSSPALATSDQSTIRINQIALPAYGYINTVAGNGAFAGNGLDSYSGNGGLATSAEVGPNGVAVDTAGNIYFSDIVDNVVRKVTATTGIITTVAGNGATTSGYCCYSGDGGQAVNAELDMPQGVAVDTAGNIYIADSMNNVIRKVTASTGIITTVAGNGYGAGGGCCGSGGYSGDGGPATSEELNTPTGIWLDGYGNMYIADYNNDRIREVAASTGIITTVAGNGARGFNGDNQLATSAELYKPAAVATDGYGDIYIADYGNDRVREVTASTGIITTVAGDGANGYSGDGGPASLAELSLGIQTGVAVDASGNLYIADSGNNRIRKVTGGTISTVAGNGGRGFNGDNQLATSAELNFPDAVAVDMSGNIYIADWANFRIRVVGGELTTTTFNPLYKVMSILYSPPGNQSSQGYGSATTTGTITTVGSSFTFGNVATFSTGIPSILSASGSVGYSYTTNESDAFTETFTSTTTITTDDNSSSSFNQKGLDGQTLSDAVNHHLDTFEIWLNPLVTMQSNGTTPVSYTVNSQPITINGEPSPILDIIGVPAIVMEAAPAGVTTLNPTGAAGVSTVPVAWLIPQAYAQTSQVNAYGPGLGAICTNNLLYQQQLAEDLANPTNPAQICTQGNQCGCTPSDFAGILKTNPLLNYNSTTYTASPYAGTVSPLELDSLPTTSGPGSGPVTCGKNAVPNGSNCRYVVIPYAGTNTPQTASQNAVPQPEPLQGATYPGFMMNDSSATTETLGGSDGNSLSVTVGGGPLALNLKDQATWTWTENQSVGNTYGTANSMALTLKSTTATCDENVSIFEDTEYHTFVFQIPTGNLGCN
jgi:sugar lactone lactonase YvrE